MTTLLRYRWLMLVVGGALLVGGAVWSEISRRGGEQRTVDVAGGGKVAVQGELGPTPGPDAEGYITSKRDHLLTVATRSPGIKASALVSLARFMSGAEVTGLAAGARVDLVFVRLPGAGPSVLASDKGVEAALGANAGCACVYGFLITGTTVGDLRALQSRPDVRLADMTDPPRADLRGWELRPILPKT